jgi:hypothetical protein
LSIIQGESYNKEATGLASTVSREKSRDMWWLADIQENTPEFKLILSNIVIDNDDVISRLDQVSNMFNIT